MAYPLAGHTNSYHTYGFDDALAGIAEAGYGGVELSAVPGWTEHLSLDEDPAAVRRKLEGYGLEAVSLSGHSDLTTPDGLDHGIKAVRWAADYGLPIVNTAVGGHQSADENEAAFLGNIGELADAAEVAGVVVALEIHGDIMASSDVTIPLLEKIGRESVKVNYDTANVEYYSGEKAVDDLPKIAPLPQPRPPQGHGRRERRVELPGDRRRQRRLRPRTRDPPRSGLHGPLLGRARVHRRALATARRRQRQHAALVRAPARPGVLMAGSIFMAEMTNLQVREYLEGGGHTVIVPVGSTEDHGDHGPLWTDVYIPLEVAKRAAPELEALVGPPIPFGIAHDHRGAHGLVHLRMDTFMDLVRDVCLSLSDVGFTRIVLLNGHYCNSHALEFAVARFHDELPEGTRVYPFPYWAGLQPDEAEQYLSGSAGIHANVGETSIVLAMNEELCDMERVRDFTPELPELRTSPLALLDPLFLATPGSFWSLLEDGGGVWGKPSESTPEKGEEFLGWATRAVVNLVHDMEDVHDKLEPRYLRSRRPRGAAR